ncbi:alpha amylase, catalytic domain protein [Burkholderia cepacia]|nr:alpha amylase, catalytic domain protein [Burkholderia cepacia]
MTSRSDRPTGTHAFELSFGATCVDAERTRFRFWAPASRTAAVELHDDSEHTIPMTPVGDGWFETVAPCGPGALYRYRLDDGLAVPDPASRFQPGGVDGPSQVVDPASYRWRDGAWRGRPWHETVLYELHVGACGGYASVERRLPAIAALGVTAVELMPVNAFPGSRNWGYDGVLPFAPDASYGRPEELKALVDTAHGLGLQVFLDVVYNHFGPKATCCRATRPPSSATTGGPRGGPRSIFRTRRRARSSSRMRCTGSTNSVSTGCASTPRTRSATTRGCANSRAACGRMRATHATFISCSRTNATRRACSAPAVSMRSGTTISTTARTCC